MSIQSLCSRDSASVERVASTQESSLGSQVRTWSTANRGSLPTPVTGRAQEITSSEAIRYGLKGTQRVWRWFFASDPSLDVTDRLRWTDADGIERVADVKSPSLNEDSQGRLWEALVEEVTNRK